MSAVCNMVHNLLGGAAMKYSRGFAAVALAVTPCELDVGSVIAFMCPAWHCGWMRGSASATV